MIDGTIDKDVFGFADGDTALPRNEILQEIEKAATAAVIEAMHDHSPKPCPCCGRCPVCGRSDAPNIYPTMPWVHPVQPWYSASSEPDTRVQS